MTKKILVVDDSSTARSLFKACFSDKPHYEIIQASLWQDALDKALLNKPFLIVLDYNMPEKTGVELAKIMQENQINAHYVLLTANTQESVMDEISDVGFLQVIEKPVSLESVESLLNKLPS